MLFRDALSNGHGGGGWGGRPRNVGAGGKALDIGAVARSAAPHHPKTDDGGQPATNADSCTAAEARRAMPRRSGAPRRSGEQRRWSARTGGESRDGKQGVEGRQRDRGRREEGLLELQTFERLQKQSVIRQGQAFRRREGSF